MVDTAIGAPTPEQLAAQHMNHSERDDNLSDTPQEQLDMKSNETESQIGFGLFGLGKKVLPNDSNKCEKLKSKND